MLKPCIFLLPQKICLSLRGLCVSAASAFRWHAGKPRSRSSVCLILLFVTALRPPLAEPADRAIDTVAGTGKKELGLLEGPADKVNIGEPFGVEIGPGGALYVCEVTNHRVLRLDRERRHVTTVAGTGRKGYSGDGGPATKALLNEPYEARFDADGNLFFVEMQNAVVRKVAAEGGIIATIAGTGQHGFSGDGGPATKARLHRPHSIALDGRGGLYIADIGNHRIRRVDLSSGRIETIAGTGERQQPTAGSVATGRPMLGPRALFIEGGTLWIALREGHSVWRMALDSGKLAHVAGSGERGYRDGDARQARFDGPKGIVRAAGGSVFVVDTENQTIRAVDPASGRVSTVAGSGPAARGYGGDGGPALKSKMDRPHGITVDAEGVLYIGDTNNHRVRRVR